MSVQRAEHIHDLRCTVADGLPPDDPALAAGFYLRPTVMRAAAGDRVCPEEDFGLFITVTTFSGEDEAAAMANSTDYGFGTDRPCAALA